jgi:hypothetical protein
MLLRIAVLEHRRDFPSAPKTSPFRQASDRKGSFFRARSGLYVKSDSVPICTETAFISQKILRAKSDASASLHRKG